MPILKKLFPVLEWMKEYRLSWIKDDLAAGITVGVMLIPQGMAYALIAGLPPEYGLYSAIVPLLIYAMMGTSRQLAVGPVALIALLVASTVAPIAETPDEYIALSILLTLMVGVIQLLFGIMRLGFLVNLLSNPVLSGFVSAAAIVIGLSQLHHILGVEPVSGRLHEIIFGIGSQLSAINPWTLGIGIAAFIIIIFLKKAAPRIPGALVAVIAGTGVVYLTGLHLNGINIVGSIPEGLPTFSVPAISSESLIALFPMAIAISLVAYMESMAVAKALCQKAGNYKTDNNQELIALGTSNIGGSFFQSFPVTGGFARSAINFDAGAKTGLASVVSVAIIAITLSFLTSLFFYLPNAVLGAIILVAVYGLIEVGKFKKLWELKHYDRYMYLATFAGTLFIGIEEGILLGVILSTVMILYRSARPHHTIMGRLPDTSIYRNINRYDTYRDEARLVFRFDAPLHFSTAEYFKEKVYKLIIDHPNTRYLILDFNGVNDIDTTGIDELFEIIENLDKRGIEVRMAQVKGPVRDLINRAAARGDEFHFHMTVEDAAESVYGRGDV